MDQAATTTGRADDLFAGGGELGALMRELDWSRTPLGAPEQWPRSLKTCVRIMLTSRQPIWIGWGPELTYLYNDPYKAIIGGKHPQALGQPTAVVWREIWDVIGPMLDTAMAGGTGIYAEAQFLMMERHGYEEETYYTFSYSPVPNDEGGIGGIICANTDETQRIIGERRMALLRELATRAANARTLDEACVRSAAALATCPRDLPFALVYLLDAGDRQLARLAAAAGVDAGHPAVPETVAVADGSAWEFGQVARTNEPLLLPLVAGEFPLRSGGWDRPPAQAAVLPLTSSGEAGRAGFLVAGLNPFRPFDEEYRGFLGLVAGQISASIAHAEAYHEEKRRAEALAELDRAKTVFFTNVSHEFRTPLTLMLGPLEALLDGDGQALPASVRGELSLVHRSTLRLLRLVNTLLDFSRMEAGRAQAVYQPTDLAAFTAELASTFRSATERAGLRLVVSTPPLPEPVWVDREMWEKIVLNFLSNAFKFTLRGEIRVSVRAVPGGAELAVRDTGAGIPAAELPHVFSRFHRVQGTEGRTHEGTGIGLALVRELVLQHGGETWVESEPGAGSTFHVRIPTGTAHLPADRLGAARGAAASAGATPFVREALRWLGDGDAAPAGIRAGDVPDAVPADHAGARVLLADDNADMRAYVARLLAQQGYRVEAVGDGDQALQAARREPPELVLSDVMMPVMDGFGLLRAVREDPALREVPVVLLSARAGEDSRIEGVSAGADDYLVKPFSARELLARVAAHVSMARLRAAAAATLRESEARFRNMADNAPVMIWVTDPSGACTYLNARWYEFTGQRAEEALGMGWLNATHPDDRQLAADVFLSANARHQPFRAEYRLRRVDGEYRWAIDTAVPRLSADGEYLGYVGSVIDITERKEAEERLRGQAVELETQAVHLERLQAQTEAINSELRQINDELAQRTREAEAAQAEAESANQAKSSFLATMSHELRTPLNAMIGYTDLLQMGVPEPIPTASREQVRRVGLSARHLLQLIEEILTYSRLEAGREEVQSEPVDVQALLLEVSAIVEPLATEKGLLFDVRGAPGIAAVHTDPRKLRQILINLVGNAVKFTDEGRVELEVRAAKERGVEFCVRDTGVGIAPQHQEVIFEPFTQLETDRARRAHGTGLGLSVSRRLARLLGGELTVQSRPDDGSTFVLYLPGRSGG